MPDARKMKRIGKLYSQLDFIGQLCREKGYKEKDLRRFFKDMEDVLCDDLASGHSVRLFPGFFIEVKQHPGQKFYNLQKKEMQEIEPYPILFFRVTDAWKKKIYVTSDEVEKEKNDRLKDIEDGI